MRRWIPGSMTALLVVVLAGPAAAHVAAPTVAVPAIAAPGPAAVVPALRPAPAPAAPPWYLPAVLALVASALRRRPRGAMAVTVVLFLGVFAFENAVHSVHHGFDLEEQAECAVAAVWAQLAAVEVDDGAPSSGPLRVMGRADTAPTAITLARVLVPDQGRAPPSAIR